MEALGSVAATLQLAETALKLKKLYSDIRNAPTELSSLVEEVAILADVLADAGYQSQATSTLDDRAWKRCYSLLKDSAEKLNKLTAELETALHSHRRTGAVRLYLRKDELIRYKDHLERVKSTMMLAQQAYSCAILTQQNELLLREIRAVATSQQIQASLIVPVATVATSATSSNGSVSSTGDGVVTGLGSIARSHSTRHKSRYDFRLPAWIIRTGIQILIHRDNRSWGINFRCYNWLPPGSKLFQAAVGGNWSQVRCLLEDGQASPFDLDHSTGNTLLHVAVAQANSDVCQLLLAYGLDPLYSSERYEHTALGSLIEDMYRAGRNSHALGHGIPYQARLETLRVLLNHLETFILHEYADLIGRKTREKYTFTPSEAMSLMIQAVMPSHQSIVPIVRAIHVFMSWCPEAISIILESDLKRMDAFSLVKEHLDLAGHRNLLRWASSAVAKNLVYPNGWKNELEGWNSVFPKVIEFEQKIQGAFRYPPSLPFFIQLFLNCDLASNVKAVLDWNDYLTKAGRLWIQFLVGQGVNLVNYGWAEKQSIKWGEFIHITIPKSKRTRVYVFHMHQIVYGPDVDDWKLFFVVIDEDTGQALEYELAGEFWQWVESPEILGIPGSFPTDEEPDFYNPQHGYYPPLIEAPVF